MKVRLAVAVACVVTFLLGAAVLRAQRPATPGDPQVLAGLVIAGPDVGFRVERYEGTTPVGELVVKHDGLWVPVQFGAKIKPMK